MIKNLLINISEIVSHEATHLQRVELLNQILFEDMTEKEGVKVLKDILKNHKETEQEFENRPFMINAFTQLIDHL